MNGLEYLLQRLDSECTKLKLIITSYRPIDISINGNFIYNVVVKNLKDIESVEHFLQNAQPSKQEAIEFLKKDKDYPYEKLLPNLTAEERPTELTPTLYKKLMEKFCNDNELKKALSLHDMFRQICGNPFSIALAAAIYQREKLKRETTNCLISVYERIRTESKQIQ